MSEKKKITDALPPAIRPVAEKVVGFATGMSRPARILVLTTVIGFLALGGFFSWKGANPSYTVLFSNLDRDDAAQVVAKLKEMKVPYHVEGDGAVIEVPEEKARELRLELAGAGLPRGGSVGFESFDKMRLGATEFEQRVLYRRALEGELGRTIGSVAAVQNARVHLVLPEKSVFVSKNEPSSASVVVKLRGGRALGPGEVAGIVHLVASSVNGLTPDRIAVVTTEGTVLHKPKRAGESGGAGDDDDRASQAHALEATLEERARSMIEKVTGAGHVDVRVTADIDSARVERVEDRYDPKQTVLRSEEGSVERTGGEEVPVAGVPGAESNLPGGQGAPKPAGSAAATADGGAPAPSASGATTTANGVTRESHTRNFEVDRITEKRIVAGGVLRRVTVAVVIDGTPSRSKEDIEKITSLVRSAVGYDEKRGDAVTVEAVPFLVADEKPAPVEKSFLDGKLEPKKAGAALAAAVVVLAIVIAMALRARKKKSAAARVLALAAAKDKANAEAVTVEILSANTEKSPSSDDLRRLVLERAKSDPATAALVMRSWLGEHKMAGEEAA